MLSPTLYRRELPLREARATVTAAKLDLGRVSTPHCPTSLSVLQCHLARCSVILQSELLGEKTQGFPVVLFCFCLDVKTLSAFPQDGGRLLGLVAEIEMGV